jgi:hypothetical protein
VPSLSEVGAVAGQLLLACVAFTIFGHGVGVLVRNVPVALCITLGWILAAEHLLTDDNSNRWLPGLVAQKITQGKYSGGEYVGALAHVYVPFLIIEAVAVFFFLRRDVNN